MPVVYAAYTPTWAGYSVPIPSIPRPSITRNFSNSAKSAAAVLRYVGLGDEDIFAAVKSLLTS